MGGQRSEIPLGKYESINNYTGPLIMALTKEGAREGRGWFGASKPSS